MLIGPLRDSRYCRPMPALPHRLCGEVLSVFAPRVLNTARICRWSCRLAPTPGSSCRRCHAQRRSRCARADARQLQDLHRADRAGAEDHLALRHRLHALAVLHRLDAAAARRAVAVALEQQPRHLRAGPQREVGAARARRSQEGLGRVPAPAALLVDLEVAHAFVVAAVEVVAGRQAGLLSRPVPRHRGCPSAGAASRCAIRRRRRAIRSRRASGPRGA